MPEGLILRGIGGFYQVESCMGVYDCKLRGIFRKEGITPLPGDFVDFVITEEALREGWIEEIKERMNVFKRPPVANVNQIAIVMTAKSPEPDLLLADKLCITARKNEIIPLIIINKTDLIDRETVVEMESVYAKTGYPVIPMSKVTMEGYDILHEKLKGFRTVFAGQSGVGKSTILNNIMKSWVMETDTVSKKIQRGRHTTRHVQLLKLDCQGYVVDTPGFSSFALADIGHEELAWMYPEMDPFHNQCRYHGCSHIHEPGCAVKEAMEAGEVPITRYQGYVKLFEELKQQHEKRYK